MVDPTPQECPKCRSNRIYYNGFSGEEEDCVKHEWICYICGNMWEVGCE